MLDLAGVQLWASVVEIFGFWMLVLTLGLVGMRAITACILVFFPDLIDPDDL